MANRIELSMEEVEEVTGGALKWISKGKIVYPLDDPSAVYHYYSYKDCKAALAEMGANGVQNEDTLKALMAKGLVYKD